MSLWQLASVSRPLTHAYEQVEFSVDGREGAVSEKKELDLPKAGGIDPERVGLRPVLALRQVDVEGGPRRAVDLDGLVEPRGHVVDEPHPDEVDANRVVYACGLVVHDTHSHSRGLGDVQGRRVARGVAAGPKEVEFRKGLADPRDQHDIDERSSC